MNDQNNINKYLRKAIDVGKKVPNAKLFASRLEDLLEKGTEDQYFVDFLISLTYDELRNTYSEIDHIENPKKSLMQKIGLKKIKIDMQELTGYATKLAYLTGVMLESVNIQTVFGGGNSDWGDYVCKDVWPVNVKKVKKLKEKGVPFDFSLMKEIAELYNENTINTLKEKIYETLSLNFFK